MVGENVCTRDKKNSLERRIKHDIINEMSGLFGLIDLLDYSLKTQHPFKDTLETFNSAYNEYVNSPNPNRDTLREEFCKFMREYEANKDKLLVQKIGEIVIAKKQDLIDYFDLEMDCQGFLKYKFRKCEVPNLIPDFSAYDDITFTSDFQYTGNVIADAGAIKLCVVGNLVKNAIDHSDSENRRITISSTENEEQGIISVTNFGGPEIPIQDRENIFNLGYSTKGFWRGIGLANARSVVEAHSGTIYVKESDREKTTFSFTLPKHYP